MLKETKFTAEIIIVDFFCVIIVGTLMLMLPMFTAAVDGFCDSILQPPHQPA